MRAVTLAKLRPKILRNFCYIPSCQTKINCKIIYKLSLKNLTDRWLFFSGLEKKVNKSIHGVITYMHIHINFMCLHISTYMHKYVRVYVHISVYVCMGILKMYIVSFRGRSSEVSLPKGLADNSKDKRLHGLKQIKPSDGQRRQIMQIGNNILEPLFMLDPVFMLSVTHQVKELAIMLKISSLLKKAKFFSVPL